MGLGAKSKRHADFYRYALHRAVAPDALVCLPCWLNYLGFSFGFRLSRRRLISSRRDVGVSFTAGRSVYFGGGCSVRLLLARWCVLSLSPTLWRDYSCLFLVRVADMRV